MSLNMCCSQLEQIAILQEIIKLVVKILSEQELELLWIKDTVMLGRRKR